MRQLIGGVGLVLGAVAVLLGLFRLLVHERRRAAADPISASVHPEDSGERIDLLSVALLALIVAAAAWLRLDGLAAKTLSHTEAIIPNIQWPPGTWPPTRTSFYETFWWHFHGEGHPQAHYFLMWAWTKVFGTGLWSLRLPSALFGIGSVVLAYAVGARAWSRRVGLVAAALLAGNGLHIYFSQYARMFMMACFLALLSTWLLLHLVRPGRRVVPWEVAYVLTSWVGIYTLTFLWTVLAAQMLWVILQRAGPSALVRRVLALQAVIVMLGAPSLAHILYRGDDVDLPGPTLAFIAEYLSFGFVLEPDEWSIPPRAAPPVVAVAVLALALLLAASGLRARGREVVVRPDPGSLPLRPLLVVALGASLVVAGLTVVALRHQLLMSPVLLLPFTALAAPRIGDVLRERLPGTMAAASAWQPRSLVAMTAIVPPLIVLALSFWTSMLTSRAFLVFVPFLLLVIAAGAVRLVRSPIVAAALAAALIAVHAGSVVHWRRHPNEQFDYAALARQMLPRMQPGDLLFVHPELWVVTPLLYYLEDGPQTYVMSDFDGAVADHPGARVWLLHFDSYQWGEYRVTTPEMERAVAGYDVVGAISALRAHARVVAPSR